MNKFVLSAVAILTLTGALSHAQTVTECTLAAMEPLLVQKIREYAVRTLADRNIVILPSDVKIADEGPNLFGIANEEKPYSSFSVSILTKKGTALVLFTPGSSKSTVTKKLVYVVEPQAKIQYDNEGNVSGETCQISGATSSLFIQNVATEQYVNGDYIASLYVEVNVQK